MQRVPITSIELEHDGTLAVRPGEADRSTFRFIYRDGTGIEWREEDGAFYPYRIGNLSPLDWYKIIVAATRNELGVSLHVTSETRWINVEPNLRQAILNEDALALSNSSLERSRGP